MTLTDAEIGSLLMPAGFRLIERVQGEVQLPPLPPHHSPASARPEHGRFDSHPHEVADVTASEMADMVNSSWYRMARDYGLLDHDREFLLATTLEAIGGDPEDEPYLLWFRIRLLDAWDLVRSEVSLLRSGFARVFTDRFVPEFTVASLDGRMMMNTTVWGNGTVSTIVIRP
ncbi:hypothetical protein [Streptomyces sp. 147326]|uniref:hypothetical protein n=1 Tax=Streptomyces sp. 147326 TaxID=3074379 RepID=UPI0038579A58